MKWRYEKEALALLTLSGMFPTPRSKAKSEVLSKLDAAVRDCTAQVLPHLRGMPHQRLYRRKQNTTAPERMRSPSLVLIFPFERTKQKEYQDADGICCMPSDELNIAAIGIAADVIEGNQDYLRVVLLHELAHLQCKDHSPSFVLVLNRLIDEFNRATGRDLRNDLSYEGYYMTPKGHYAFKADGTAL